MARFRPTRPAQAPPAPPAENETPERVFHDAAARFLDVQLSIGQALDTRTAMSFSVGSTILPVTFGLLTLAPDRMPTDAGWVLTVALLACVALVICAFVASTFRALDYRPKLDTLNAYSARYDGAVLLRWVATEYEASTRINEHQLERKAQWTGWAGIALYAEGGLLSIAALLTLL